MASKKEHLKRAREHLADAEYYIQKAYERLDPPDGGAAQAKYSALAAARASLAAAHYAAAQAPDTADV